MKKQFSLIVHPTVSGIKNIQYSVGQKSNCCNQLATICS